jgi:tetratricopeptide (TPR) repeat protein
VKKMLELDPLSVFTWGNAGTYYLYGFEYDQAIKHLENAMELDPGNTFFLDNLGLAHIQKGMLKEGLAEVKKAAETAGADALFRELAYAYVKAGMPEEARKILTSLLQRSDVNPRGPIDIAGVYAALGEKAQALDWLDRAFEEKSGYVASVGTDFVFESIWTEPRFKELQKKMGLGT